MPAIPAAIRFFKRTATILVSEEDRPGFDSAAMFIEDPPFVVAFSSIVDLRAAVVANDDGFSATFLNRDL
jgi:hypothetical protein